MPGVWAKVLRELRDRLDASVVSSVPDPRLALVDPPTEFRELKRRAAAEAAQWYAGAVAAGEAVVVSRVVLRAVVVKGAPVLESAAREFVVSADDVVSPQGD